MSNETLGVHSNPSQGTTIEETKQPISKFRTVVGMMISPGNALKSAIKDTPFYFSIIISAVAFALFFLQTGLDMYRTGQQGLSFVYLVALVGVVFGAVVVPILATVVWLIAKMFGCDKTIQWTISAFCLSYCGALVYCILGIIVAVFYKWRTAIAFGVSGVLWAIGPMIAIIREMIGGKIFVCIFLSSAIGSLVLYAWSFIGKM